MTVGLKGSCVWSELLNGRGEGDGGEGGGELDVGADRDGAHTEHAGVLRQLVVSFVERETSLHQRLQAVHKQLHIFGIAVRLGEETSEPPQPTKTTTLQEMQLLLTCVLTTDHVLDDRLNCCQDCLVMAEAEDVCDLRIKQGVDDWEHLGEDNTGLGKVFVENPDLCLISGVLHQCGQNSKNQHLCDVISEYVGVKEYVVVVGHAGSLLPCIGWTRGAWANLKPGRLTAKGISVLASLNRVPCLACRTSWHGHRPLLEFQTTTTAWGARGTDKSCLCHRGLVHHLKRLLSLLVNRQVCHSWAWRTTWLNWARAPAERKQPEMVVYSKVVHEWTICSRPSLTQLMFHMASASHLFGHGDQGREISHIVWRHLELVPAIGLGNNGQQHGKDPGGASHCCRTRVAITLDQVAHQGEVEVGTEAQTNAVVKLLEMPLQGIPCGQHDAFQALTVKGVLTVESMKILLQQGQA